MDLFSMGIIKSDLELADLILPQPQLFEAYQGIHIFNFLHIH